MERLNFKERFRFNSEDEGISREEANIKYDNDPLYWKDYADTLLGYKEMWDTHWNMPMGNTLYRKPPKDSNRHPDWDKVKVPEKVTDIDWLILDVSLFSYNESDNPYYKCEFEMLEEHVKEMNDFYKELTGKDEDYTDMQSALWEALEKGIKVMTGNIDSETIDYQEQTQIDSDLVGWQHEMKSHYGYEEEEKPSNVVPIKSGDKE